MNFFASIFTDVFVKVFEKNAWENAIARSGLVEASEVLNGKKIAKLTMLDFLVAILAGVPIGVLCGIIGVILCCLMIMIADIVFTLSSLEGPVIGNVIMWILLLIFALTAVFFTVKSCAQVITKRYRARQVQNLFIQWGPSYRAEGTMLLYRDLFLFTTAEIYRAIQKALVEDEPHMASLRADRLRDMKNLLQALSQKLRFFGIVDDGNSDFGTFNSFEFIVNALSAADRALKRKGYTNKTSKNKKRAKKTPDDIVDGIFKEWSPNYAAANEAEREKLKQEPHFLQETAIKIYDAIETALKDETDATNEHNKHLRGAKPLLLAIIEVFRINSEMLE